MTAGLQAAEKTLTEKRDEFARNGYLRLPGVLSAEECAAMVAVMDRLDAETKFNTHERPRKPGDVLELHNCVARDPLFLDLIDRPEVLEVLGFLMGCNIQLGSSHCFIRPPAERSVSLEAQGGFSWHYDLGPTAVPVNGRLPHLATRVGYCFTPLNQPDMGSISVVPGSHRVAGPPASNPATGQPYGAIEILADAGDAIIFDNRLWHSTMPNYSGQARKNLYMEYAPRWLRPFDYYRYDEDFLAGASDVRKQLLGFDFTDILDGGLGYQQPHDIDIPLRGWLAGRGLTDIPLIAPEQP
jgi:ectoine hydroxylase